MVEQGWNADVQADTEHGRVYIEIVKEGELDFIYDIRMREYARPSFAFPQMSRPNGAEEFYYRAEVFLRRGGQTYDVYGYDQQELIGDILDHFEKYLHFLHISPGSLPWNMAEHDEMLHDVPVDKPAT
jgi:choline/glycine/proline betaine transport protein